MDKGKILIVDDEPDVLRTLEKRLSSSGYSVIKASNGVDALRFAKAQQPGLILLDILMPGMDGGEVAYQLSQASETKNIPILFLTCLLSKDEELQKSAAVGHFFLSKPYDPDGLLSEISKHIRA